MLGRTLPGLLSSYLSQSRPSRYLPGQAPVVLVCEGGGREGETISRPCEAEEDLDGKVLTSNHSDPDVSPLGEGRTSSRYGPRPCSNFLTPWPSNLLLQFSVHFSFSAISTMRGHVPK